MATRKVTDLKKLANGATIKHEWYYVFARNSTGAVYYTDRQSDPISENKAPCASAHQMESIPRTIVNLNCHEKEAYVEHLPAIDKGQGQAASVARAADSDSPVSPEADARLVKIESLGTKTIAGASAVGTRTTWVIPAGRVGNDLPIDLIKELWTSRELATPLVSIWIDPRQGTHTDEVTYLERGEPDPSLFRIPEGYAVTETYRNEQK